MSVYGQQSLVNQERICSHDYGMIQILACNSDPTMLKASNQDTAVNAGTPNDAATALHTAVRFGHLPVVSLLLQSPRFTAINSATCRDGHTALHLAAVRRSIDITRALLDCPRFTAEAVGLADKSGRTALQIMGGKHDHQAMELLRESGKLSVAPP